MPCVTSMAVATMSGVSPPLKTGGVGVGLGAVSPSGVGVGDGITIGKGVGVGDGTARSGGSGGEVATGGGVAVVRSAGAGVAVGVAVVSSTGTGVAVAVSRARGVLVGVAVENENEAGVDVAVGASCAAAPRVGLAGPTPRASISKRKSCDGRSEEDNEEDVSHRGGGSLPIDQPCFGRKQGFDEPSVPFRLTQLGSRPAWCGALASLRSNSEGGSLLNRATFLAYLRVARAQ